MGEWTKPELGWIRLNVGGISKGKAGGRNDKVDFSIFLCTKTRKRKIIVDWLSGFSANIGIIMTNANGWRESHSWF